MYERSLGIERLGTIREIAKLTRLGQGTVHRALKGETNVSAETRDKVIAAVREINARKIRLAHGKRDSGGP